MASDLSNLATPNSTASRAAVLQALASLASQRGWLLATAESCTGGGLAKAMTELPGSSAWFTCGLVTYSNQAKTRLLGVASDDLNQFGAVSEEVVRAMVAGACTRGVADFAVATSGIAGPGGGSAEKPLGTVWLGWGSASHQEALCCHFSGDRRQVREASIDQALVVLLGYLNRV